MQSKPSRRSARLIPSSLVEKHGHTYRGVCRGETPVVGDRKHSDPRLADRRESCTRRDVGSRQTVCEEPDRKHSWLSGPHYLCRNHSVLPLGYKSSHR